MLFSDEQADQIIDFILKNKSVGAVSAAKSRMASNKIGYGRL